jgi:hypothetical protein
VIASVDGVHQLISAVPITLHPLPHTTSQTIFVMVQHATKEVSVSQAITAHQSIHARKTQQPQPIQPQQQIQLKLVTILLEESIVMAAYVQQILTAMPRTAYNQHAAQ